MLPKPACLGEEFASAFQETSVAAAYQNRPPYPAAVFSFLADLIAEHPRRVLDVGCGTGFVARHLVNLVDHIDAIDVSQAMIDAGRRLPNGDHARLNWIVGRAEDTPLSPPYTLITAGDSLHWLAWPIALPRFASMLTPGGWLVILQSGQLPLPWDAELLPIIKKFSIYGQIYQSVDLIAELEQRRLFQRQGAMQTQPALFEQPIDAYVESFHGRASLARERMGSQAALAFDAELRKLVSTHTQDRVKLQVVTEIAWGKPLMSTAEDAHDR
jgi:ubiquinone/menaquinone biosynthesis C-methylase UbiE